MNTLHLKAKSRGSWTNVCPFPEDEISYVQAGAEGIARAAAGAVSFKITDDKGGDPSQPRPAARQLRLACPCRLLNSDRTPQETDGHISDPAGTEKAKARLGESRKGRREPATPYNHWSITA